MSEKPRCEWCSRRLDNNLPMGRRRRYCTQACRQRAYEKRREQHGSGTGELAEGYVAVRRSELESLQDRLYVLRSAVEILDSAIAERADAGELTTVGREVVAAAGDLDRLWVSP